MTLLGGLLGPGWIFRGLGALDRLPRGLSGLHAPSGDESEPDRISRELREPHESLNIQITVPSQNQTR